ncbi:acyltransferase family protein [Granulosicoccus antarcticus]|uniref:O-acetyltransferase OatA n=1 Tax=Granulosicoccus antarcticus IMCC3135 TaxID=1192854 RepID=A0A2Z2NNT4_9GAMM|nr:acyltransferase family protein [Granulosicoccus antarcticus]ASJ72195.1 O-acetyltransferase OatA [Granulosicoccus antarcticus IMCC3135]
MKQNSEAVSAMTPSQKYQPEIDGLRTIAVMSVVLFHLEFKWIPGGFVGVDVFFVISGFLITRLLVKDVQAGNFSFKHFYLRRIRRLGPALIAVLLGTFVVAAFFLTPDHFQRFSGALLASLFSASNLFFWAESGYFDATAELKPLLHTWSLSVEEQFYLVWPALIFLVGRRSRWVLPVVVLLLSLLSLYGALVFTKYEPSAGFFLMPFRIYEFGIGAGLALLALQPLRNTFREFFCLLGLLMIGYSLLAFDKLTPFPDIYALLPCMGAALVIVGGNARFLGYLLRNPISVWVGKISYSLYLVHWPIVVLYKHVTFADAVLGKTRIALLVLMFMAAPVMYYGIEKRFRFGAGSNKPGASRRLWGWLAVPLVLSMLSVHAYAINGWSWRFDDAVIHSIGILEERQQDRRQFIDNEQATSNLPFDAAAEKVLVMGDSHSTDMFNALYLNVEGDSRISVRRLELDDVCLYLFADKPDEQVTGLSASELVRCGEQYDAVLASEMLAQVDRIVISTRWQETSFPNIEPFANFLRSAGKPESPPQVVVMGRSAEFKNVPALILQIGLDDTIDQQLAATRTTNLDALNENLKQQAEVLQLPFVDKVSYLCSDEASRCDAIDEQGLVLYTDYGHWSLEGARLFGQRMLADSATAVMLTGMSTSELNARSTAN